MSAAVRKAAEKAAEGFVKRSTTELHGIVVSAGLMDKTVRVKFGGMRWEPRVQKAFHDPSFHLVHDPNNSVRLGDVIAVEPSWRTSKTKKMVVKHIIAPCGPPIEERPPVMSPEERVTLKTEKRIEKLVRRFERQKLEEEERLTTAAEKKERAAARAAKQEKFKLSQEEAAQAAQVSESRTRSSVDYDVD